MNKKLKRIKSQMKYWQDCPGESYSVSESTFEWLIEQAEREFSHSIKINKLHFFLDNNVADLASERCGYHVIDVAIYVMKKQAERIQDLEEENERLRALDIATTHELNHIDKVNKRYREEIEFAREELFLALCESKSELEKRHHVKSARHFLLKALEG